MTNIYFQPDYQGDDVLVTIDGKQLSSSCVYSDLEIAKQDFPDRPIIAYSGDDIEEPFFVDREILSYPEYASTDDRKIARKLIDAILSAGYGISIEDCEELVMKASLSGKHTTLDYLKEMAGTGIDTVTMWDLETRQSVGWFYLIYNNSCGDPMELISDYSNNELSNQIYRQLEK